MLGSTPIVYPSLSTRTCYVRLRLVRLLPIYCWSMGCRSWPRPPCGSSPSSFCFG